MDFLTGGSVIVQHTGHFNLCYSKMFLLYKHNSHFTFSHLADTFIQSDLQMGTMEAIKTNKRAMICKSYNKSQLN